MFDSTSFRWTYMTWTFFGVMTSTSVFLALTAFILGIVCRINFGKGLVQCREFELFILLLLSRAYAVAVNAEEPIPDDFVPVNYGDDPEKFPFPSDSRAVPTYSAVFDPGLPPSQVFAPQNMWQTFSTQDGLTMGAVQVPATALAKQPSHQSCDTVERHQSTSSTHSSTSTLSRGSDSVAGHSRRWVIE